MIESESATWPRRPAGAAGPGGPARTGSGLDENIVNFKKKKKYALDQQYSLYQGA